jgi:hypothetical protein
MKTAKILSLALLCGWLFSGCAGLRAHLDNDKYEDACDQGNAKACQCAAWDALHNEYKPGPMQNDDYQPGSDERKALADQFLEKACKLGDQAGCKKEQAVCIDDSMSVQNKCARGDSKSCEAIAPAPVSGAELEKQVRDPLYKLAKFWQDYWEGAKTHGIVDLAGPPNHEPYAFTLTQIVNGYAVFHYSGMQSNPIARFAVAIKKSSLGGAPLAPEMGIGHATQCLRFLRDEAWENEMGFPMNVKTYTASKCK